MLAPPPLTTTAQDVSPIPFPRAAVSDLVDVPGNPDATAPGGVAGSIAWQLVELPGVDAAACTAATDWASASTVLTGITPVEVTTSAGQTTIGPETLAGWGCYSWAETLTGGGFVAPSSVGAGAPNEFFYVQPYTPTLTTTMGVTVSGGVASATDTVVVSGTDLGSGGGAPSSAALTWTLYGPLPLVSGSCAGYSDSDWESAASQSGSTTVTEGTNAGIGSVSNLSPGQCYAYGESMAATTDTLAASSTPSSGSAPNLEYAQVPIEPSLSTTAGAPPAAPRDTVTDSVTVTGTGGGSGTLTWALVGPVAPVDSACTSVTWPAPPTTGPDTGSLPIVGDQSDLTVPASTPPALSGPGCYSWVDTLTGDTFPGTQTLSAGSTNEFFLVQALQPTLSTTMNLHIMGGVASASDSIVVAGTDFGAANGAPASASLSWTLLGPVAPVDNGCSTVDWTGATVADTGTIDVTGDGTYTAVPTSANGTDLTPNQCYGFTETLPATTDTDAVTSLASADNEYVEVAPTPVITSQTSAASTNPLTSVSDSVTISGTDGEAGTLTWSLIGPVAPAGDGTCDGADWSAAPATPVGTGTEPISGDGTLTTGPVTVDQVGCYSWVDALSGNYPAPHTGEAGSANEVVQVVPYQPELATTAVMASGAGGTKSVVDDVTLAGSGLGSAPGAPTSAVLSWALFGPVAPVNGSCTSVTWPSNPPVAPSAGTITVTGDGSYVTPSVALTAVGCYSFAESLPATNDAGNTSPNNFSDPVLSLPGVAGETVLLVDPPVVGTTTSASSVYPNTHVSDSVVLNGSSSQPGGVAWSLIGPVPAAANGSCTGLDWAGAPTVPSGSGVVATSGDGPVTTGPVTVTAVGCYSWVDAVTGPSFLGQTVSAAGSTNEVVRVQAFAPTITTAATFGTKTLTDDVTIAGSGIGGDGAPNATLTWTLFGPAVALSGTCSSVDWNAASVKATGTVTITGDGTYATPAVPLAAAGCYTFSDTLAGSALSSSATSDPGQPAETLFVSAASLNSTVSPSSGGSGGVLAFTGAGLIPPVLFGLVLIGGGTLLVIGFRRRRWAVRTVPVKVKEPPK